MRADKIWNLWTKRFLSCIKKLKLFLKLWVDIFSIKPLKLFLHTYTQLCAAIIQAVLGKTSSTLQDKPVSYLFWDRKLLSILGNFSAHSTLIQGKKPNVLPASSLQSFWARAHCISLLPQSSTSEWRDDSESVVWVLVHPVFLLFVNAEKNKQKLTCFVFSQFFDQ